MLLCYRRDAPGSDFVADAEAQLNITSSPCLDAQLCWFMRIGLGPNDGGYSITST